MANTDSPFGLQLVEDNSLTPLETCIMVDATAAFIGDAVKTAGSSDSIVGCPKKKTVSQCAATDPIYGVIVGFQQHMVSTGMDLGRRHRPANVDMYVLIKPANHQDVYRIQCDDDTETLSDEDIGCNADLVVGSGNTISGMSAMELDSNTTAATAGLQLKIIGFDDRPDNEPGVANQKVLVRINQSELGNDAGTAAASE